MLQATKPALNIANFRDKGYFVIILLTNAPAVRMHSASVPAVCYSSDYLFLYRVAQLNKPMCLTHQLYEFLLAFRSNEVCILHRFWDITRYWSKNHSPILIYPIYPTCNWRRPSLGLTALGFCQYLQQQKTRVPGYNRTALFAWSYV